MLGGLVLAATLVITGARSALAQPVPAAARSADTFYTPPSDLASLAPGAVIRSRTVGVPAYGIPLPVQAWQLLYRSNNTDGTAIAATTTVIVPPGKPAGPRPLISYQAIINALDPECSPSRTVPSGGLDEIFMLLWPLLRGWAVSVPDHAGPNSNYGAGHLGGQVTLDGVRAVEHFAPTELGPDTPVGLWGYSGGGFSTAWAAELQASYAPELNVVGSAEGGVPADFNDLTKDPNALNLPQVRDVIKANTPGQNNPGCAGAAVSLRDRQRGARQERRRARRQLLRHGRHRGLPAIVLHRRPRAGGDLGHPVRAGVLRSPLCRCATGLDLRTDCVNDDGPVQLDRSIVVGGWRCRESNPGPPSHQQGFSVRSPLCLYLDLLLTQTSQDDDPSRCLVSPAAPRPTRRVRAL